MRGIKRWLLGFVLVGGAVMAAPTNDGMYATLQTTLGEICFELYYTNVPQTVANFVSLAEGSRPWIDSRSTLVSNEPFYNGIIFHRVVSDFMIQCGSPNGTGTDGPGYTIQDEFDTALRLNRPGVVAMANSGPDSNGGQFFITVAATPWLNDVHSVFGSVVEGMTIVSNIASVATNAASRPLEDITITNVFITRNGTNAQGFAVTNQSLPEVEALPISITCGSEIELSTGTAASSYQYVYSSTNLTEWTQDAAEYWAAPDGNWAMTVAGEAKGFFRANRVAYRALNTNIVENIINHQLVITIGSDVFHVLPQTGNSGVTYLDEADQRNITYWEWRKYPYFSQTSYSSVGFPPFRFDLYYAALTGGRCRAYYYNNGWTWIGDGTFTDQDLN